MSRLLVTLLVLAVAVRAAAAPVALLHAPVPAVGDEFGAALATSSTRIVVGAPGTRTAGLAGAGAAHLFDADGKFLRTLMAPVPSVGGAFGVSVAMVGSNVAVGAESAPDAPDGVAYLFDGATGALLATFRVAGARGFGGSLATVGGRVVVGADGTAVGGADGAGAAYVLLTTGALVQTLLSPAPAADAEFGAWVAPAGTNVVVGAPGAAEGGVAGAGTAWVVDPLAGVIVAALHTPQPTAAGAFGARAAGIDGDALVGAPGEKIGGVAGGAAHRFAAATGALRLTLAAPVPIAGAAFGSALAGIGDGIVVGAPGENLVGLTHAGRAYLFDGATAGLRRAFESPSPVASGFFGATAATVAADVLVGEPGGVVGGADAAGAVHRFSLGGSGGGGSGGGQSPPTSTTTLPPFGCAPTPIFDSITCRLDGLAALVAAQGGGRVSAGLLHRLAVARAAVVRAADPAMRRRRRLASLSRAIASIRAFETRLSSRAGLRLFSVTGQPAVFAVADPIVGDLDLLRATL